MYTCSRFTVLPHSFLTIASGLQIVLLVYLLTCLLACCRSPNDDCSPRNLTKISDSVYLNLFDEVVVGQDEPDDGHEKEAGSTVKRLERRWLGSLRIPFSTLYLNSKIEGTFCLNMPPMLLGYEHDSRSYGNLNRSTGTTSNGNGSLKSTYLTLFLTIDPTLQQPEPLALKVSHSRIHVHASSSSVLNTSRRRLLDFVFIHSIEYILSSVTRLKRTLCWSTPRSGALTWRLTFRHV